jgi:hypothetical protein
MTTPQPSADTPPDVVGHYQCAIYMPGNTGREDLTLAADNTYEYDSIEQVAGIRPIIAAVPEIPPAAPTPPAPIYSERYSSGTWSIASQGDGSVLTLVDSSGLADSAFTTMSMSVGFDLLTFWGPPIREFSKIQTPVASPDSVTPANALSP